MKKLLAFLLLFGTGMGLLLWVEERRVDREQRERGGSEQEDPSTIANAAPTGAAEGGASADPVAGTSAPTGAQAATGAGAESEANTDERLVTLGGQGRYTRFGPETQDGRDVRWILSWKDSRPGVDEQVELLDVFLEVFDTDTETVAAEMRAERGVLIASQGQELTEIELGENVLLHEVVLDLFDTGAESGVGLRLRSPSMHLEMVDGAERFWTDERAVIEAEGLHATGPGLEVELRDGLLTIPREGEVTVELAQGGQLRLDCEGELVLQRRPPEGPGPAKLTANGGAVLTGRGEEPFRLRGRTIELYGRSQQAVDGLRDDSFTLEHVIAQGEARFRSGTVETDGELARLLLFPDGRREATVEGEPVARVYSQAFQEELDLSGDELSAAPIVVRGAERIVLHSKDGEPSRWESPGPSRVLWDDWVLNANGGVEGSASVDGKLASFHAWDEVVLAGEDLSELACPELRARWVAGAEGEEPLLQLDAAAPARVAGVSSSGAPFRLVTEGALAVDQRGEAWSVRRAEGVNLLVEGESGRRLRAGLVSRFEPKTLAFEASGGVAFEGLASGEALSGHGDRASSEGEGHLLLLGSLRAPARFDHALGRGSALVVERRGDRLWADGSVLLAAEDDALSMRLACDALEGEQSSAASAGEQRLIARALGRVRAHIDQSALDSESVGTRYDLDCDELELERRRLLDGEELLARHTWIEARTVRRGEVLRLDEEGVAGDLWLLVCDELNARRSEGRDGRLQEESVLARGEVWAELESVEGTRVAGRGHELTIGLERIGRLSARPGERVLVEGALPGGSTPFELTASMAEFTALFLRALEPAIVLERMLVDPEDGSLRRSPVQATALELVGTPSELLLLGQAHIVGELDAQRPWELDAGKVRLAGPAGRAREAAAGSTSAQLGGLESMQAWDGFELRLGEGMQANGERLGADADAELLHVEGEPAVLRTAGMLLRTPEFDYDLVTNTVRTGPGRIEPNTPLAQLGEGQRP